ncbi:MAG: hypothetical protein ACOYBY_13905 [Dermatophilaceae bacterium]
MPDSGEIGDLVSLLTLRGEGLQGPGNGIPARRGRMPGNPSRPSKEAHG